MTARSSSKGPTRRVGEAAVIALVALVIVVVIWPRVSAGGAGASPDPTQAAVAPLLSPTTALFAPTPAVTAVSAPTAAVTAAPQATIPAMESPVPSATAAPESPTPIPTGYTVSIPGGLNPQWTAGAAAAAAFWRILLTQSQTESLRPAQVVSVEAMEGKDVPNKFDGPFPDVAVVWVVHAYGTFANAHGPVHYLFDEGWYLFNDADGNPFAVDFSHPVKTIEPTE